MTIQNVENKYKFDGHYTANPKTDFIEIEGIKLRDSLFLVYSQDSSSTASEYIYSLEPIDGSSEIVFDKELDSFLKNGGPENCGVYLLDDQRILKIETMNNWFYMGGIFKNAEVFDQFLVISEKDKFNH